MVSEEMLSLSHQFLKEAAKFPAIWQSVSFSLETEMEFQRACTNISCIYFFSKEFWSLSLSPTMPSL